MKRKINWKLVFNILSLLVPIGLVIYFLTSEQGLIDLMENASKMNPWWIVAGVICQFLNITVDAIVLYLIIHNYEKKYTFKQAIKATVIGQFYSVITPGAVGGQPMQLYCMSKQGVDGGVASSCLLQKFLVYQTTITFYSLVAMLCNMSLFYGDLKNLMLSLALALQACAPTTNEDSRQATSDVEDKIQNEVVDDRQACDIERENELEARMRKITSQLESMTIEEKIGQMLITSIEERTPGAAPILSPASADLIRDKKIGGVIFFGYNIDTEESTQELIAEIKKI